MSPVKLLSIALTLTGVFILGESKAQIKIGTNGTVISPSSILELESANQGLLLPRMADTVAINALNPPNGMLIYLTKAPAVGLYVRKVTGWEYLTGSLGGNGNFSSLTVAGSVTAGSFSGPLTGNATTATTALNATNSANSAVVNDISNPGITYPVFVNSTPGNQALRTSSGNLSYVPATGILTARGFNGPLVGDVTGNATSSVDAQNTVNVRVTDDLVTPTAMYPLFTSGTAGPLPARASSSRLSFVPLSGELTATTFRGALIGNASSATTVTGNVSAVNGGTGQSIYSVGDMLYASASNTLTKLPIGTLGNVLRVGAGNIPQWSTAGAGTVINVSGTANRISVTDPTVSPVVDIASTYAGQSSITTLGTIGTGTWNGSTIGVPYGGTGLATLPAGRVLIGNGTGALAAVNGDVPDLVLTSNGPGLAPSFKAPGVGDMVLSVNQTITGVKTFGQAGNVGKLVLAGNTTGTTTLNGPAIGSNGVVTLPDQGVLVSESGTQILTNKTLNSPSLVSPILGVATGTSLSLGGGTVLSTTNQTGTGTIVMSSAPTISGAILNGTTTAASITSPGTITATGGFIGTSSNTNNVGSLSSSAVEIGVNLASSASITANNTLVRRDASGDFTAGTITATLSGNATNVSGIVAIANGGTGQNNRASAFNALSPITTAGDIIYGNGPNSNTRLAAGGTNTFLKGGTTPSWSTINLAAASPEVTGILPAANGGTGVSNSNTLTLSGGSNVTLTTTGVTNVTLPVSGTLISAISGSIAHDFPSTNTTSDISLTVNGAADGDPVSLGIPNSAMITVGVYSAWVSAPNTVTIRLASSDGVTATTNPGSGTFKVVVFK